MANTLEATRRKGHKLQENIDQQSLIKVCGKVFVPEFSVCSDDDI